MIIKDFFDYRIGMNDTLQGDRNKVPFYRLYIHLLMS